MDLLGIRKKFRDLSGRYDLVNEDGSDRGANFFVNEACRWLDKTVEVEKTYGSYMEILAIGTWYVQLKRCRAIKDVWLITSDGRAQLEKITIQDMLASYFTELPSAIEQGTPSQYSPAITRLFPEGMTAPTLAAISAFTGLITSSGEDYNAILLSCPLEESSLIEVDGYFYSMELVDDDDVNYWTVNNSLLLINTILKLTHTVTGNKPMLDLIDKGIGGDLMILDKEIVEQDIAGIDQMEG
jgi:hypothetical protein